MFGVIYLQYSPIFYRQIQHRWRLDLKIDQTDAMDAFSGGYLQFGFPRGQNRSNTKDRQSQGTYLDLLDTIHPSPLVISVGICRITPLSSPLCCHGQGPPTYGSQIRFGELSDADANEVGCLQQTHPSPYTIPSLSHTMQDSWIPWSTLASAKKVILALHCLGDQVLLSLLLQANAGRRGGMTLRRRRAHSRP